MAKTETNELYDLYLHEYISADQEDVKFVINQIVEVVLRHNNKAEYGYRRNVDR